MRTSTLLARSLTWYWRTNLAVLLGVATATGVIGGAALVGHSVRASLRRLVLDRLGGADHVVTRNGFFREKLAPGVPIVAMEGMVAHEASGKRAVGVEVYGVGGREISLSAALARELGARPGDTILLRIPKPSAIPRETLHGNKDDVGKTVRLAMSGVAAREFSLRPQQGDLRAVYVPLARLQRDLNQPGKVNTILTVGAPVLKYALEDLGVRLRVLEKPGCLSVESDSAILSDTLAQAVAATARSLGLRTQPVLAYLANSIRAGGREVPYSVVAALDAGPAPAAEDGIVFNEWTARRLGAKPGDAVELDYYVWKSDGRLITETARFRLERTAPMDAADPQLTPDYPGITESPNLRDWDPPFPLALGRIRPADEQYWNRYRTTPKAFVRLARGRGLWGTRFGSLTSIRVFPPSPAFGEALRTALNPAQLGLTVAPVKAQALEAAQGATDFGEYFLYFSFFLMVSALLLTGLFFRLGVEQRRSEIGVLRALGFSASKIRTVFLLEGAALAMAGAAAGIGAALGYGALILLGLRTWWFDAVGTRMLSLHASLPALAAGAAAGVLTGLASVAWTLRGLLPVTPRGLLAGERQGGSGRWRSIAGAIAAAAAVVLMATLEQTAGFFGAGTLALTSALLFESAWLHRRRFATAIGGQVTLGLRSLAWRPGRSILCIALIASATFVIVSLDTFRRSESPPEFPLVAESVLPLLRMPQGVRAVPFRVRTGDDASCLNLYRPRNPRILGAPAGFLRELDAKPAGGAVPAIADANSLTYVLHRKVGEEFELGGVRYRMVAALQDSVFQGELLISEKNFLRVFPDAEGYRFFLLKEMPRELEESLSDYGFHVQRTQDRLAAFHKVENTYLATFRALGGLGLVLGTVGLAAVLLRNVLERRRELALLRAVGYRPRHLRVIVLAEQVYLLMIGLATGAGCALVAVAPAVAARGGHLPVVSLSVLLALVLATGVAASWLATAAALRSPVLDALRSE